MTTPIQPFPQALSPQFAGIVARLEANPRATSPQGFSVLVEGEAVAIPDRIYVDEVAFRVSEPGQTPFVDCLLTRHHNGFVRARALDRMLGINQPWSSPYVAQLVGEYVVEILDQIEAGFDRIDPAVASAFLRENGSFLQRTERRVMSYWACYYRHIDRADYVGFRLIERFKALATTSTPSTPLAATA